MSGIDFSEKISESQGCPNALGVYSGYSDGKVFSGIIRCGSWTCPFCGPRKLKQLRKRLHEGEITKQAISRYGAKFATFTFGGTAARKPYIIFEPAVKAIFPIQNQSLVVWFENQIRPQMHRFYSRKVGQYITGPRYDVTAMYDYMMTSFNKLRTALVKHYGKFMYFRVYEPHQDGVPHLHVLFIGDAVIPKSFLETMSKLWSKYGLGFVQLAAIKDKNGKPIRNFKDVKHAVNYLLKYMTKDVKKAGRYRRVFSCSQKTLLPLSKKDWKDMKIIMGVVDDVGKDFIEEVVYDSDEKGNPAYEFEAGVFGSEAELREAELLKGHVEFDGETFVRVPSDIISAIQEVHISQLTQSTINKNRGRYLL